MDGLERSVEKWETHIITLIPEKESEVKTVYCFVDNYPRTLDEKGRMILPPKVRDKLEDTVFICKSIGDDKCLYIYPKEEWYLVMQKLRELPITLDRAAAKFMRGFSSGAKECSIDKQGRINLDAEFLKHAGINKNMMLVGVNSRLEVWSAESWEKYQQELSEECILEGIAKYGLNI